MSSTIRTAAAKALAAATFFALSTSASQAQIGLFFGLGNTDGTYCKFSKKNKLMVHASMPLDRSESYTRDMALHHLAKMAQSKEFPAFVVKHWRECGTLSVNSSPESRSCKLKARMVDPVTETIELKEPETLFDVAEVLARTEKDAATYPERTGLLAKGSECVND